MGVLLAPLFLVVFWYRDFFLGSVKKSEEIFTYVADLLSIRLLFKTYLKPLKNEYRDGLVVFSIGMGLVVKTLLLLVSAVILAILFVILAAFDLLVFILPGLIIWLVI